MKPLAVVAGFLGSGKTSLLRTFLANSAGRKLIFVVNEFADEDVDATLVTDAGGLAMAVAGGSVFCECKADDFKTALARAAAMGDVDGVVVEASGMADPRALGRILSDPRLRDAYHLVSLVAVVDPLSYRKLRHTLPTISRQIVDADVIVINKCDCADEKVVENVAAECQEVNPRAEIIRTVHAQTGLDPLVFRRTGASPLMEPLTTCGDRTFVSLLLTADKPIAAAAFAQAVTDLGGMVTRVKGWLDTTDGRRFVETDGPGRPLSASSAHPGPTRLVIIAPLNAKTAVINRLSRIEHAILSE